MKCEGDESHTAKETNVSYHTGDRLAPTPEPPEGNPVQPLVLALLSEACGAESHESCQQTAIIREEPMISALCSCPHHANLCGTAVDGLLVKGLDDGYGNRLRAY